MNINRLQLLTFTALIPLSLFVNAADQFCFKTSVAPNVYYWNDSTKAKVAEFPGVTMTDAGNGLYCSDIDASINPTHVIFIPSGGDQTADLPYDGTNNCYMNGSLTTIAACELAPTIPTGGGSGMKVTVNDKPKDLAETLAGDGIKMSNFSYEGLVGSAGTFTGGSDSIGIESGIILTNGGYYGAKPSTMPDNLGAKAAENTDPSESATSGSTSQATDLELEKYLGVDDLHDAAVLEFDFETTSGELYFEYVFASEEYNEYVNSAYNDVFALFVDGENIALLPSGGGVVSINNVNNGRPGGDETANNSQYYIDNDPKLPSSKFTAVKPIIYNGFTVILTAQKDKLNAGSHHMKFVIADMGDTSLDSAIFIKAGSFKAEPPVADDFEPVCSMVSKGGFIQFVSASDDSGYTEDENGNGIQDLPEEEDDNSNELFEVNSGIKSISLSTKSNNLVLDDSSFAAGLNVEFSVYLKDETQSGNGSVLIKDGNGNVGSCKIPTIVGKPIDGKVDDSAPTCSVTSGGTMLIGEASDDILSEDLNGDGVLSGSEEDLNKNELVDYNSGIASIKIIDNDNLELVMDKTLVSGVLTSSFKVKLKEIINDGTGSIIVTDVAGNESSACKLNLTKLKDPSKPVAVAQAFIKDPTDPTLVGVKAVTIQVGELVYLDARLSSDVDDDIVQYAWDIDSDGDAESYKDLTYYTFTSVGTYNVKLTVTDAYGLESSEIIVVTAQNPPIKPETPDNQAPIITEMVATVDGVPVAEIDYLPKGYTIFAKGDAEDPDGKVAYYVWKLLDENDNLIKEYHISTTPVDGEYELKEYHFGRNGEGDEVDTRDVKKYKQVEFLINDEGVYKVVLDVIDDSAATNVKDKTDIGSSDEIAATDRYVESGSLTWLFALFGLMTLVLRRKN